MSRHPGTLLQKTDLTKAQFLYLVHEASLRKAAKAAGTEQSRMSGKNIALVFEKNFTRTRCAFEVAVHDQGATSPTSAQRGRTWGAKSPLYIQQRCWDGCLMASSFADSLR